ncbi:beta strand repeat-containing protein [Flavobacterium sp. XGLA_31]|uniref:beta strand repeat-containing protein n=1 Tax=Flavobacterium sp. XGLA_31 TaxID=3447666 RepID=UPI003F3F1B7B
MKTKLQTPKMYTALIIGLLFFCTGKTFAALKVTGISVSSQSTTVTYGTASSTTYTLTLTESGNGNGSSVLSINWTPPAGVTVTGLGTTALTGNGQTVTITITTDGTTSAGTTPFTISSTVNVVTSASADYVVSKRALTITANNASKTYGTTQSTPVTGATAFTANGLVNGDTIGSVTLTYGSGALLATSNAGTTSVITPSAATGGTFSTSDYNISYVNGTLTVVAATPTVTVTVGTYTYTGSAQGPNTATNTGTGTSYTFSYSGTGSTTYGPSATRPTNAGTYTVTATVAANGNYTSASSSATAFTIGVATPTVTVTVGTYTYSGSAQGPNTATNTGTGTTYTYSYSGTGSTTYGPSATRPTNVGTYTATATVAANGNYGSASSSATAFSITGIAPVVTVTVGTYTYTGSAQGPNTATNTGTGTSYTYSYSGTGGTVYGPSATRPTNAGSYVVMATVAANGNYAQANGNSAFSIQKAPLTITASNATKDYGTTYTLGTTAFTTSGLLGGQTIGGVTLTSAGATAAAAVGTYPIVPSAATGGTFNANNYTITYTNGTLTVNGVSIGGTVTGDNTVCPGTGATLSLSGQSGSVVRWEYAVSPFTSWTTIANTATTYTSSALTQTTRFRAVVQYGSSPVANSTAAEVTVGATTIWNGTAWSNGTPDALKAAVMTGNYTSNGTNITACSLTVNNNATVLFSTGDTVDLKGALTVATGSSVTFDSNANLIQHGTANTNSGNVTIKRESALLQRLDYTLWSSPVANQQLQAFSPQTLSNRFYTYNTATNLYDVIAAPSTTTFDTAKAYLIRVGNNHPTTPQTWVGSFVGVPNNGNYTYTLQNSGAGNRFNLIGNPYPSPLDIDAFINNTNNAASITGTLYFWRKTNGSNMASYCTMTPLGGFVSNGNASANAFAQNPIAVIQAGQGFFVEATGTGSGTVQFDNTMRSDSHLNHFLKTNDATSAVEKNRIWLNATNAAGDFSQTMVGYITNATQEVDAYIDGKYINDGDIALASLIGTTPYAIQGRALPFDAADVVPLSFKATTAGDYTIAIDHADGLFADGNQAVLLRDNLSGTVHDLHTGGYTFASDAGTFTTRFELVYQQQLGVSNPTLNASQVVIYRDATNNLVINSGNQIMSKVKVFDITGKLLLEKNNINAKETALNISLANEVVLVQITTDSGVVVTKKHLLQRMTLKKDKNVIVNSQIANDE